MLNGDFSLTDLSAIKSQTELTEIASCSAKAQIAIDEIENCISAAQILLKRAIKLLPDIRK